MGKQNMHDHSVRVPLIVAGPNVPEDRKRDAPIYLQDVMPTSLEWAGVMKPDHVEFQSLVPLLQGNREQSYAAIYGAYTQTQRMVTLETDKLIVYPKIGKKMLFDLHADPLETNDLADRPESQPKIQKLLAKLQSLQQQTGDKLDLTKANDQ
jgi:choline-sulfatase